jgi:antitoxin component YwqK of YwqJK toxin-antitoxin module
MKIHYSFILSLLSLFFIVSCSEAGSIEYTGEDEEELLEEVFEEDTLLEDTGDYPPYKDAYAMLDGPDEWFYMIAPEQEEDYGAMVDLSGIEELHIIPYPDAYSPNDNNLKDFMMGIAEVDFELNSPYNEYSGRVLVFYDNEKTALACDYEVINGKPTGFVTLMDPLDRVFIERVYNEMCEYERSNKEPYAAMWTLDQPNSNLKITDTQHAFSAEGSNQVVSIMPSQYYEPGSDNTLYQVMAKETFKNQFKINGDVFTGILRAYFHPNSFEEDLYYELPFRNGRLHGDIMIYDEWGGLYLHEIFVDGELDSTVFQQQYEDGVAKPIIYLYPEKDMVVNVELEFDGELTHTYPKYNNGWNVMAKTDGTLYDEQGKEYYALYWEGDNRREFKVDEGFVVPGYQTTEFLEKSLDAVGLNRREANEFIVYWLPHLENNKYNLIHFSTTQYEEMAKLNISPKPETMIRVMMVYKPLDAHIDMPVQDLSKMKVERKGFTVVEWGGSEVKAPLVQ